MPPMPPARFAPRKLLVAAVGVATLNYLACAAPSSPPPPTAGNLTASPVVDAATGEPVMPSAVPPTAGNLPAPQPVDAEAPRVPPPTAGNLMREAPDAAPRKPKGRDAGGGG